MLFKRILYGGIGIAIVWLLFLAVPMWLRNVDHPLTAQAIVDVCAYLDNDAVLATLPQKPEAMKPGIPGNPDKSQSACSVELAAPDDDRKPPSVWVAVTTERMLSADRRPLRTDRYVDVWLRESEASGSTVTPIKGPWRRGAVIRERARPAALSLLADDAGLVVWVNGHDVEYPQFVAFAEAVARRLREKANAASAGR